MASNPAASITEGFDVLVHDVMAAMTTDPFATLAPFSGRTMSASRSLSSRDAAAFVPKPSYPSGRFASIASTSSRSRNASTNECGTSDSGDAVLWAAGARHRRLDRRQVEVERLAEHRLGVVVGAEETLFLRVTLDRDPPRPPGRCRGGTCSVWWSHGKNEAVAPYSGHMLESVARSSTRSDDRPGPKNSTNFPTTPCARSICVSVSTRSVAVVPGGSSPLVRTPTTTGQGRNIGWPSMAASASIPPTPQPRTDSPFTIVVCESVPSSVSGSATPSRTCTTRPRCSRFTWWQMPIPGGTTRNPSNACWAHRSSA